MLRRWALDSLQGHDSPSRVVQDQFFDFASTMVNTGPDAFFARIGRSALVNTMVLPGASYGLKRVRSPCGPDT